MAFAGTGSPTSGLAVAVGDYLGDTKAEIAVVAATSTADGVNLTNEKIVQFASDSFRPRAVYDNGRYYFLGMRYQR